MDNEHVLAAINEEIKSIDPAKLQQILQLILSLISLFKK